MSLYRNLADELAALIRAGSWKSGERLPSVRELCRERGLSIATITRAYELLEAQGFIEAAPRSGYYVTPHWSLHQAAAVAASPTLTTALDDVNDLVFQVIDTVADRKVIPLGSPFPGPEAFPLKRLARGLSASAGRVSPWRSVENLGGGSRELRELIATRYMRHGATVSADEIIVTNGGLEALNLSLQALTRPGDAIAIEAPAFYGCLQAVVAAGLRPVEIPTHPRTGLDLAALEHAIATEGIRVCWFMTTFQNPTGACLPDSAKLELVRLLESHDVPLIEDNVYAELYFGDRRPQPTKAFDRKGLVLDCSSFSKCLAPGYRVGWVAAGRFALQLRRRKMMASLGTSTPAQDAIVAFLQNADYDRHLRKLRRGFADQQAAAVASIERHFGSDVQYSRPDGGYFLWLELPASVDAVDLHRRALGRGISVAPGPLFSARGEFRNCLRLNCGHPWNAASDAAVGALAEIMHNVWQRNAR